MELILRPIFKSDIEKVVKCENDYFHNFTTYEKIIDDINNPLYQYYVLVGEDIYGYVFVMIDEDKAQINSLVVLEKYRNRGYGKLMLNALLSRLKEMKVQEITLEVRPSNNFALKLYNRFGFKQVAIRKNYYNNGEDAFLMYKNLGS
ncbi:MAG: ribosomal protein S18-alanine N-acetyltransferase [Candidatus Izemoplasmatales bacterium]